MIKGLICWLRGHRRASALSTRCARCAQSVFSAPPLFPPAGHLSSGQIVDLWEHAAQQDRGRVPRSKPRLYERAPRRRDAED